MIQGSAGSHGLLLNLTAAAAEDANTLLRRCESNSAVRQILFALEKKLSTALAIVRTMQRTGSGDQTPPCPAAAPPDRAQLREEAIS